MSNILILEEILVGFCGQFGGGEMKDGIFVSAYKCRKFVWGQVARPPSDRCHKPGLHFTFQGFIKKRLFEVTVQGQARSSYHSYRLACELYTVYWYNSRSSVSWCLLLHTTRDLLMSLSFWCLQKVALQPEALSLAHGWTGGLPGPDPIAMWLCASKISLKSRQLSLLIHFAASAWIVEESHWQD